MQALAGWYPDPSAPGILRYWTGQQWTDHTAPDPQPATYTVAEPAASWPAQAGPWTNPYAATASQQRTRPTAAIVTLSIILAILAIVITAEISHVLTVRSENASDPAAGAPITAPTYVPPFTSTTTSSLLPSSIAGLSLNPESQTMSHHLPIDTESQLSQSKTPIIIGYYDTPDGSPKVFIETIENAAVANSTNHSDLLTQLEGGYDGTVGEPIGSTRTPVWTRVPTSEADSVMACENLTQMQTAIHACAFVQGSNFGIIGVYRPAPADAALIDEVRRTIAAS